MSTKERHRNLRHIKKFVSDFETTTYEGQTHTEVWASALCSLDKKDDTVIIHDSIEKWWYYLICLNSDCLVYFHNLRFDGHFILYYLMEKLEFKPGILNGKMKKVKELENGEIITAISDRNQWYEFTVKDNDHLFVFRDSLKVLPFPVKTIAKSFGMEISKGEIDYTKHRFSGEPITEEEQEYIKNDVLIVKKALLHLFDYNIKSLTIGSAALQEFKSDFKNEFLCKGNYDRAFPNLYQISILSILENETRDEWHDFGSETVGEYIRKSYRGGWCYVKKEIKGKVVENGCTADVNSLYPSMMSAESENIFPYGEGKVFAFSGNLETDLQTLENFDKEKFLFLRFNCFFKLKEGYLPFYQVKNNPMYPPHAYLESAAIYDYKTKRYYTEYLDSERNEIVNCNVNITMTLHEFKLFREHYELQNLKFLDGVYFDTDRFIFQKYVNKYRDMKINAQNKVERTIAKLMQNSLYGKFCATTNSSYKYPVYDPVDNKIEFLFVPENEKIPGYIPIGSAITSYARCFTVRAAQQNYDTFCYADTDSIHCTCSPDELNGITIHDKNFSCWKIENVWDKALFVRQKTYLETWIENNKRIHDIKCAGMGEMAKSKLIEMFESGFPIENFKVGLSIDKGKLVPVQIPGGVKLETISFIIRPTIFF